MLSTFTLIAGEQEFKLKKHQSPRGLRNGMQRPTEIHLEVNERFPNRVEFLKFLEYLQTLADAMKYG